MTAQDKQEIIEIINASKFNTQVITNSVRWIPYAFSANFTRQFPSNTVLFINTTAVPAVAPFNTPAVLINDIFRLIPGASLALNANKDEIDMTIYKCTFDAGATLSIWIKEDAGMKLPNEFNPYKDYNKIPTPDKRLQDKEFRKNRVGRKGGEF